MELDTTTDSLSITLISSVSPPVDTTPNPLPCGYSSDSSLSSLSSNTNSAQESEEDSEEVDEEEFEGEQSRAPIPSTSKLPLSRLRAPKCRAIVATSDSANSEGEGLGSGDSSEDYGNDFIRGRPLSLRQQEKAKLMTSPSSDEEGEGGENALEEDSLSEEEVKMEGAIQSPVSSNLSSARSTSIARSEDQQVDSAEENQEESVSEIESDSSDAKPRLLRPKKSNRNVHSTRSTAAVKREPRGVQKVVGKKEVVKNWVNQTSKEAARSRSPHLLESLDSPSPITYSPLTSPSETTNSPSNAKKIKLSHSPPFKRVLIAPPLFSAKELQEILEEKEEKAFRARDRLLEQERVAAAAILFPSEKPMKRTKFSTMKRARLTKKKLEREVNVIVIVHDAPSAALKISQAFAKKSLMRILKPISVTRSISLTIYHYHVPPLAKKPIDGVFIIDFSAEGKESRREFIVLRLCEGSVRGTIREEGLDWKGYDGAAVRVVEEAELNHDGDEK